MNFDRIGKFLHTNNVEITPSQVRKQFNNYTISMAWRFLERKRKAGAKERYTREKDLILKFQEEQLNTPELISYNDKTLELCVKTFELTDLVEVLQDPAIHKDDKLTYFKKAVEQLYQIHNLGETHGDTYLKNFFKLNKNYTHRDLVYTCDFEYTRDSPDPIATDILILVADASHALNNHHPSEIPNTYLILEEVYGKEISFPFDMRDHFFFRARFGMKDDFFKYFGR